MRKNYRSTKHYILEALIPYTEANLALAFRPSKFFNDLRKIQNINERTARTAFYRAVKDGLVEIDDTNTPRLTKKGLETLKPFKAKQLKGARIMVIFDIPEVERWKRRQLRTMLKEFSFSQVQQSVWMTNLDCIEYVREQVKSLSLEKNVKCYEAIEI